MSGLNLKTDYIKNYLEILSRRKNVLFQSKSELEEILSFLEENSNAVPREFKFKYNKSIQNIKDETQKILELDKKRLTAQPKYFQRWNEYSTIVLWEEDKVPSLPAWRNELSYYLFRDVEWMSSKERWENMQILPSRSKYLSIIVEEDFDIWRMMMQVHDIEAYNYYDAYQSLNKKKPIKTRPVKYIKVNYIDMDKRNNTDSDVVDMYNIVEQVADENECDYIVTDCFWKSPEEREKITNFLEKWEYKMIEGNMAVKTLKESK